MKQSLLISITTSLNKQGEISKINPRLDLLDSIRYNRNMKKSLSYSRTKSFIESR